MIDSYIRTLKNEFSGYNMQRLQKDILAGLTVAAVALPLALAFGVSSGADAAAGLITAILAGFVISALSGASFQVSGPTGAMTAVLITIVAKYHMQGVFAACLMAGILLLIAGFLKLGRLISFIPMPVITGFTSGIAVIIALGQIDNFFGTTSQGETMIQKLLSYGSLGFHINFEAVTTGLVVVLIMMVWPEKWGAKVPSSLIGIIVAAIISNVLHLNIPVVGDIPRTLLPVNRLNIFGIDYKMLSNLISPAFTIAALGMIESLLCGASASRMKKETFHADQELMAQGIGNILIPFFGGVPATAAIARTSVAIKSGGQTRLTGIFHAVGLLASMFVLGPVMARLPLSALAGVLLVTAWKMNEWSSIRYIFNSKFKGAIMKFFITMTATIVFDLTIAIIIGVLFSVFVYVKKSMDLDINFSKVENKKLRGYEIDVEDCNKGTSVIYITGPIFFGNVHKLSQSLKKTKNSKKLIFSMRGVNSIDTTGAQILIELCGQLKKSEKSILFCGVNKGVKHTLIRAGMIGIVGRENFYWSVDKALLSEALA